MTSDFVLLLGTSVPICALEHDTRGNSAKSSTHRYVLDKRTDIQSPYIDIASLHII